MIRPIAFILLLFVLVSCKDERSSEKPSQSIETREVANSTNDTIKDLLNVAHPAEGQLITSTLEITGEARGYWFFEATASVELLAGNMDQISESYITATGEWMTEDWVPFSGTINFEYPSTETGYLILHKANASGLPQHAMSDIIQVRFK